jgi:hypothetical protein
MAIVKVTYTRSRPKIKANLRYIAHRPGREGEKISRLLFDLHGIIDKDQAYRLIDETTRGRVYFKVILSPDPKREDRLKDLDLQHITRKTIRQLQAQLGRPVQLIATIHDDHAPHRHVHGIMIMHGRLSREDFKRLRETATQEAKFQRRTLDLARENLTYLVQQRGYPEWRPRASGRPANIRMCPDCGVMQSKYAYECFNCGASLWREFGSQREEIHLAW